jgi:hypothetical protein
MRGGIVNGKESGTSTYSVKDYTNRFLHYMRQLCRGESVLTTNILIIDRYVAGIRAGYEALYMMMLGVKPVLRFTTLNDAIDAAQIAEADLDMVKLNNQLPTSSAAAPWANGRMRPRGGAPTRGAAINNLEGGDREEGETEDDTPPSRQSSKKAQLNAFVFNPAVQPKDGRYALNEKEGQMLYDEKRCFRCHQSHPTGRGTPHCTRSMPQTAPKSKTSPPATDITSERAGCSDGGGEAGGEGETTR